MKENSLSIGRLSALVLAVAALAVAFVVAMPTAAHAADYTAASADSFAAAADVQAPALSAATTTKTVKTAKFTTELKVAKKKAVTVKKGTTKLKVKKSGYIVFKAPKTKTYYLKFSNAKAKGGLFSMFVEMQQPYDSKYVFLADVATKGGRTDTLWLADKAHVSKTADKAKDWRLASRTAKIKMKKGEKLYMFMYTTKDFSITLNIK